MFIKELLNVCDGEEVIAVNIISEKKIIVATNKRILLLKSEYNPEK